MEDSLRGFVKELTRGNPDVVAAVLVDADGRVHASEGDSAEIVRAALAFVVPLRDMMDRAAAELGCGALRGSFIEGDVASLALADVDGNRSVIVIGGRGASPGALRADSLWLAARVRAEVSS